MVFSLMNLEIDWAQPASHEVTDSDWVVEIYHVAPFKYVQFTECQLDFMCIQTLKTVLSALFILIVFQNRTHMQKEAPLFTSSKNKWNESVWQV